MTLYIFSIKSSHLCRPGTSTSLLSEAKLLKMTGSGYLWIVSAGGLIDENIQHHNYEPGLFGKYFNIEN